MDKKTQHEIFFSFSLDMLMSVTTASNSSMKKN